MQKSFTAMACALFAVTCSWAAEPWAKWTCFAGLSEATTLKPDMFTTQNQRNGNTFTFNRGGAQVAADGWTLQTGTGNVPYIDFGSNVTLDVGYNSGNKMTVLIGLKAPLTTPVAKKPFIHVGNGSNGIGVVLHDVTGKTLSGSWGNAWWNDNRNACFSFEALGQTGVTYLAINTGAQPMKVRRWNGTSFDAQAIGGLMGNPINAQKIAFGNFVNATSDGMNYELCSVTVFNGDATDDDLKNAMPVSSVTPAMLKDVGTWSALKAKLEKQGLTLSSNVTINLSDSSTSFVIDCNTTLSSIDVRGTGTVQIQQGVSLTVDNYRVEDTASLEIAQGGTLTLNGAINAVTGKLAGCGLFRCTLQNEFNDQRNIKLGEAFKGTTELLGGNLTLNNDTRIGTKLKVSGGHLQTKAAMTLRADLEIAATNEVQLHCNENCPLTLEGHLTGTGTLNKLGKTNLTLKGNASDIAGLKLGNIGHLVIASGARLKLPNVQNSETGGNKPSLVVEQGGTLTIGGVVTYAAQGALTLKDGAKIERVRDSALGLNSISALTVGGTVSVALIEPAAASLALQPAASGIVSVMNLGGQSGVSADNFSVDDASVAGGWGLYAAGPNLQLVNAGGVLPAEEGDPAYVAEAAGEILNEAYGTDNPTYSVIASGIRKPMKAQDVNAAYTCFNGHLVIAPAEGEVAVAYNFGVSDMRPATIDGKTYVVFAATVEGVNEDQRLEYSPAVTLEVNEITEGADVSAPVRVTEVTGIDGTEPGKSINPSVRYLRMPMPDDTSAHIYRVRALGSDVVLGSVTVVAPSAGIPVQMLVDDGATLLKMQPKREQTSLSLTLTGAGTQVGQTYRLVADGAAALMGLAAEAEPTVYGTAVMTEGGRVVFENIRVPANTTVRVVAADCSGDVMILANSWDVAGVTLGKTAAVTRMVAVHPKYDFPEYSAYLAGDDGADAAVAKNHSQYRIPGLATNGKGEVIGVYDIRWLSQDDLGVQHNTQVPGTNRGEWSPMDMGESYSGDNGRSWNAPIVGYDAPNTYDPKTGARSVEASDTNKPWICDVGDPCIVYVPGTAADNPGYYLAMGITGGGLASAGGANKNNGLLLMKRPAGPDGKWVRAFGEDNLAFKNHVFEAMYRAGVREDDSVLNGVQNATDVSNQTRGILQGPGHAMVTAVGRDDMPAGTVVFPMQWFWNTNDNWPNRSYAFAIYLKPGSKQWESTHLAGPLGTQENCIAELDDGSWYMIAKKSNEDKRYHYRSTDFSRWEQLRTTATQRVQGSLLRLGKKNGVGQYAMAYSTAEGRRQLKVFFGSDIVGNDGKHDIAWDMEHPLMVHEGDTDGKSYNSMCLLDGGKTLGFLYEANMHVYFKRIDISDRVDVPAK